MKKSLVTGLMLGIFMLVGSSANAVMVNGVDWRQPTETVNFNYNDMATIYNVNTGGLLDPNKSTLNGVNFSGYVWASIDEVKAMFSSFDGLTLGSTSEFIGMVNSSWAPAFMAKFAPTGISNDSFGQNQSVEGLSRSVRGGDSALWGYVYNSVAQDRADYASIGMSYFDRKNNQAGVWLYSGEATAVPEPTSILLIASGIASLIGLRRKK